VRRRNKRRDGNNGVYPEPCGIPRQLSIKGIVNGKESQVAVDSRATNHSISPISTQQLARGVSETTSVPTAFKQCPASTEKLINNLEIKSELWNGKMNVFTIDMDAYIIISGLERMHK
jgi:hypothetical protein